MTRKLTQLLQTCSLQTAQTCPASSLRRAAGLANLPAARQSDKISANLSGPNSMSVSMNIWKRNVQFGMQARVRMIRLFLTTAPQVVARLDSAGFVGKQIEVRGDGQCSLLKFLQHKKVAECSPGEIMGIALAC
jgi:hypothetical protein